MISPKFLIGCAVIGFIVSFAAGIFGGVSFGVIVLRSLLFALFAAAAGFGLRFLVQKFLLVSDESIISDAEQNPVGSMVDITLEDGELSNDDASLSFDFKPVSLETGAQRESAENTDSSSMLPQEARIVPEDAANRSTAGNSVFNGAIIPEAASVEHSTAEKSIQEEMEVLPNIEVAAGGLEKPLTAAEQPESDFSAGASNRKDFDGSPDSSEMVKAIRTFLSKDT